MKKFVLELLVLLLETPRPNSLFLQLLTPPTQKLPNKNRVTNKNSVPKHPLKPNKK